MWMLFVWPKNHFGVVHPKKMVRIRAISVHFDHFWELENSAQWGPAGDIVWVKALEHLYGTVHTMFTILILFWTSNCITWTFTMFLGYTMPRWFLGQTLRIRMLGDSTQSIFSIDAQLSSVVHHVSLKNDQNGLKLPQSTQCAWEIRPQSGYQIQPMS